MRVFRENGESLLSAEGVSVTSASAEGVGSTDGAGGCSALVSGVEVG